MRNFRVVDIVLSREETSRKKWPMSRTIHESSDGFVQIVNVVVGTNALKTFRT